MQLRTTITIAVVMFMLIWFVVFYHHERNHALFPHLNTQQAKILPNPGNTVNKPGSTLRQKEKAQGLVPKIPVSAPKDPNHMKFLPDTVTDIHKHINEETKKVLSEHSKSGKSDGLHFLNQDKSSSSTKTEKSVGENDDTKDLIIPHPSDSKKDYSLYNTLDPENKVPTTYRHGAQRGVLICNGERVDSEVIYWRVVPNDLDYESPITPHHGIHDDRYLTFEYDQGGWNNIRMGLESLIVVAHAMGRTLVIPPQQHLYLLSAEHKDPHDKASHNEMGFEDFFDIQILRSHRGFNVLSMEEFLSKEAVTGGLRGIVPPQNSTKIWGQALWSYLNKVADAKPTWMGRFIAFPKNIGDFNLEEVKKNETVLQRLQRFGGDRSPVFYDESLQKSHHIHFPARESHRVLQHHYAFAFFADEKMQSFYRRFVRDFMRYKDTIQCAGAELVGAVRADSRKQGLHGEYYALHIRRGDFQYKEVKHSAAEIIENLRFQNGTPIIPPGSLVYISTDDPDGICKDCYVQRKPCTSYTTPKPPGCPEDTSWRAFTEFGWKIRFLKDYLKAGYLPDTNPNVHGMVESIICSRAKAFAGTFFSTFTGYIHRLRGYHGLGESTYYHTKRFVFAPQMKKSVGHGFSREWRAGWTDDGGLLI